jgi:hypothetical protein
MYIFFFHLLLIVRLLIGSKLLALLWGQFLQLKSFLSVYTIYSCFPTYRTKFVCMRRVHYV